MLHPQAPRGLFVMRLLPASANEAPARSFTGSQKHSSKAAGSPGGDRRPSLVRRRRVLTGLDSIWCAGAPSAGSEEPSIMSPRTLEMLTLVAGMVIFVIATMAALGATVGASLVRIGRLL